MNKDQSLTIANPYPEKMSLLQKLALTAVGIGLLIFVFALFNYLDGDRSVYLFSALGLLSVGAVVYAYEQYKNQKPGIKNNGVWFKSLTNRGAWGWLIGIILTTFYVVLYWFPELMGKPGANEVSNSGFIALFNPLSQFLKGQDASQWFLYGTLYTLVILVLGVKFIYKYRHSRYQVIRTLVVMASQFFLAYFIPEILAGLNYNDSFGPNGEYLGYFNTDLKNTWPLDYDFFFNWQMEAFEQPAYQPVGKAFFVWGLLMFLVVTPIVTYFVGKRWYCSWICGCGGLAETAGDPYRHLSDKSTSAWLLERLLIHGVMVFVFAMTAVTLWSYFEGDFAVQISRFLLIFIVTIIVLGLAIWQRKKYSHVPMKKIFGVGIIIFLSFFLYLFLPVLSGKAGAVVNFNTYELQKWYGFFIGAAFSGVIGVGFYPLLGNRVWCRFGCPMAGYMGIIQRFKSRFRITTNGGQCISCGNCSTYCEQGIDVRAYAQRGENIVRASCVGCGVCSSVCPRGVLKLENGPEENRIHGPINISSKGIEILED